MADKTSLVEEGQRHQAAGELDQALAAFKRAFLLDTGDLRLREQIGDLLASKGRFEHAIREYRLVAASHAKGGALLEAIALCKKILVLEPSHRETQEALAQLYAVDGEAGGQAPTFVPATASAPQTGADTEPEPSGGQQERPLALRTDMPLLPRMPVFSDLSREAFVFLIERLNVQQAAAGELILREGDADRAMYVVVKGTFAVTREADRQAGGAPVALLGPGSFFGEMALVAGVPRLCSVVAWEEGQLLQLDESGFRDIEQRYPAAAAAVVAAFRTRLAADLVASSPIFRALPEIAQQMLVEHNTIITCAPGETLLEQGAAGNGLYLLLRGQCDVLNVKDQAAERRYAVLSEGDVFGEISALTHSPCTATVRTHDECVLLHLPQRALSKLVTASPDATQLMLHVANRRLKRTIRLTRGLA